MAYFRKLVGERCYLSPLDPDDAARFAEWANDPEVAAGVTLARQVVGVERMRDKMARHAGRQAYFAIVALDGDEPIGNCGIDDISAVDRTGELVIMIGDRRFWDRGFGTDAVRLLLRFGFLTLGLNNIRLRVHAFNERAIRCYEKCGFRQYAFWPDSWYHDGALHGSVFMYLLRADCKKLRGITSPIPRSSAGRSARHAGTPSRPNFFRDSGRR